MSSENLDMRKTASSESESEDEHPVDEVIRRAIKRGSEHSSPATSNHVSTNASNKKKRKSPSDTSSAERSPDKLSDQKIVKRSKRSKTSVEAQPASTPPIGVTVVEEGQHVRNPEMQRLLRGARQVST